MSGVDRKHPAPGRAAATLLLCLLASLWAGWARAQGSSALVEGTVQDSSGAAIAGASVTLESSDTGLKRTNVTKASGSYFMSLLPPGSYSLTVELKGFKTYRLNRLVLGAGQSRTVDVRLDPAEVAEVVEVADKQASLERFSPEYGRVVSRSQLRELPLNGRQWTGLMILAPGASQTSSTTVRLFGRASNDNNWTLDGVDATGILQPPQDSSVRLVVSLEALSEFRVSSSLYTADAGLGAGSQVQLVSKSGTNRLGGTAYEYLRDDAFDAPSFGSSARTPFRMHQFGGSLAGPLRRDKTFFFLNYEALRQSDENEYVGFVPSARFRSAAASAAPALVPFLQAYPAGSQPTADGDVDQTVARRMTTTDENSFFLRLDHRFSDRMSLMARYNLDRGSSDQPQNVGIGLRSESNRPSNFSLQLQRILSPSAVNTLKVAANGVRQRAVTSGYFDEQVSVPGFVTLTGNQQTFNEGRSLSLVDDLSLTKGRHNLRLGGEVRRIRLKIENGAARTLSYASRSDFSANRLDGFSLTELPAHEARSTYYSGYVQDDVKLSFNFTLNAGLRYEYYSVMREAQDRAKVFALGCGGYCAPGTPFYEPDRNNVAPRMGFNWAPGRFGYKTVFRGGYGIYFGPGRATDLWGPILNDGQRTSLNRTKAPALNYPVTPFLPLAQAAGENPVAIDRSRQDGYTEQYGVSIQQQLPAAFVLQLGYFGSRGHKMYSTSFVNLIDPATGLRPLPQFSNVQIKGSQGDSTFNGLHVSLQRRTVGGFSMGADYALAYATDDGSVGAGDAASPQNVNDPRAEVARSSRDVRHAGTLNWVYELPWGPGRRFLNKGGVLSHVLRGWQVAGLLQARSGRPLTVTVTRKASDLPDGNSTNQRPDLVPGVSLMPPGGRTAQLWINPAAFAVPAKGQWGNAPRNLVTGPALVQLDLALSRLFRLSEARSLELQWDVFNVFNRDQLGNPTTNISAGPSFGQITSPMNRTLGTGTNRQMQFMLRLNF